MTCDEFDDLWQSALDDPDQGLVDADRLGEHATTCASCAERAAGYQALLSALPDQVRDWRPSPGFADRVVAAEMRRRRLVAARRRRRLVALGQFAVAASL